MRVTPDHLKELEEEYNNKNWENFKRVAHTIKPNAEFMGIASLKEIFRSIDNLPAEEVSKFITTDNFIKLKEVLTESCSELSEEIKHL